ncbi:MAG: hypothetical protein M3328_17600 [Chloroflexota bacterium]|nr:hypothetical protein [Chloroflexota bacterium]
MPTNEYDEYARRYNSPSGCVFWLAWLGWAVATFIAFILGDILGKSVEAMLAPEAAGVPRALSIAQPVDAGASLNLLAAIAGGLVAGVVLAVCQCLVLLPFMKRSGILEWAGATILGRTVAWVSIYLISKQLVGLVLDRNMVGVLFLLILLVGTGVIAGLAVGIPQSIVLYRRVQSPARWIGANLSGLVVTGIVNTLILYIQGENVLRDFNTGFAAAITAISTAVALIDMFSQSTSEADWVQKFRPRKAQVEAPRQDTVLGSTLYGPRKDNGR